MKKLLFSVALVAAAFMVSCSAEKKAEDEGAALKAKIENCSNPDSLKVYVEQAKAYADKLVSEGKGQAAEDFLNLVTPAVEAKDPSFVGKLKAIANEATEEVKAAADSTANAAKEKVEEAKDAAKDAAKSAVDNAKEKASDAADAAKQSASDAVQKGADKLKKALN